MRTPAALRTVQFNALLAGLLGLGGCAAGPRTLSEPTLREFRGVFVAMAFNKDWPLKANLDNPEAQKNQMRKIVQRAKDLNCNVIFLQVRAFGDRIHRHTKIEPPEPWSGALTKGNDPDPNANVPGHNPYDPLAEWILECHKAGIELHAWINPFRVSHLVTIGGPNPGTLPVRATGDGFHMLLDASNRDVQDHALKVIAELLKYQVTSPNPGKIHTLDGVLFDHNWGYPPPKGQPTQPAGPGGAGTDAGGEAAHAAVAAAPSAAQRKRAQVQLLLRQAAAQSIPPSPPASADDFIKKVAEKAHKMGAKFGFSPGLENDDVNSWLNPKVKEWMDQRLLNYVVPELYFREDAQGSLKKALDDWLAAVPAPSPQHGFTPVVVAGLFTTRVQIPEPGTNVTWPACEIIVQVEKTRSAQDQKKKPWGEAHYACSALHAPGQGGPKPPDDIGDLLKAGLYAPPALVPECMEPPAGAPPPPPAPEVELTPQGSHKIVTWTYKAPEPEVFCWAVWLLRNGQWGAMQVFVESERKLKVPGDVDGVAVKAIDRYNRESKDFGEAH